MAHTHLDAVDNVTHSVDAGHRGLEAFVDDDGAVVIELDAGRLAVQVLHAKRQDQSMRQAGICVRSGQVQGDMRRMHGQPHASRPEHGLHATCTPGPRHAEVVSCHLL
jgi:hypothetical protein